MKSSQIMALTDKDWYEKGLQLKHRGHYQKAIQAFNQAIDNKIKFGESYFERGICHYKLGNYRQTKIDLEAAALLGCKDAQLWSRYDRKRYQRSNADKKEKLKG